MQFLSMWFVFLQFSLSAQNTLTGYFRSNDNRTKVNLCILLYTNSRAEHENSLKLPTFTAHLILMELRIINIDPDILGGIPVFFGTRVPIKNLFDYLESGKSIDFFLDDFEGVHRDQVVKVLEMSQKLIETSSNILHENFT